MPFSLRIPDFLYNKLKKIAFEEKRSINSEICYIIELYVEEYEKESKKEGDNCENK